MKSNLHLAWSRLFARGLAGSGVRDVVVSPGSRSTPLVLGLDAEPALRKHVIIDERAAAFFALGQARASGLPTALLCTSGTAAAHYLPAVAEASLARVPLIVISADRPWEAYDCAASQTIDQVKLFGDHVRHHAELGLPDLDALPAVMRVAAQAALRSRWPDPGPVHVNARFRKPLEPVDAPGPEPHDEAVARLLARGPAAVFPPLPAVDPAAVAALLDAVRSRPRGLIVAGPAPAPGAARGAAAVHAFARATGYPLLAESTSQLRGPESPALSCLDALFRCPGFLQKYRPELVIELGMPAVSAAYGAWLASQPSLPRVVVAPHGWNDPHGSASSLIWGEPAAVLGAALAALGPFAPDEAWGRAFGLADAEARRLIDDELASPSLTEGAVARAVASHAPPGGALLVGNSGPVRDLDLYGSTLSHAGPVAVLHQRGAAGIDGLVAGAAGAGSALGRPSMLFVGDVSLLHDVGSLHVAARQARELGTTLVIVATNNDGGRIFEQLPLARRAEVGAAFERYFLTRHGADFGALARASGVEHRAVSDARALDEALEAALAQGRGVTLIEAIVAPEEGARRRAALWRALAGRLEAL